MSEFNNLQRRGRGPGANWIGIAIFAVFIVLAFFILRGIFRLLYFLAPIMLIATLIIDYKVVIDYVKQLGGLFRRNFLYGLGAAAFTFFLYPIVFAILLFRAITGKRQNQLFGKRRKNADDEYADYEIIDDELDLKEFDKVKEKRYDGYFREE